MPLEDSPHFHEEAKGCRITFKDEEKIYVVKNKVKKSILKKAYCHTHKVVLLSCGWELYHHHGTFSPHMILRRHRRNLVSP